MPCYELTVSEKTPPTPEEQFMYLLIVIGVILVVVFLYNDIKKLVRDTAMEMAAASR